MKISLSMGAKGNSPGVSRPKVGGTAKSDLFSGSGDEAGGNANKVEYIQSIESPVDSLVSSGASNIPAGPRRRDSRLAAGQGSPFIIRDDQYGLILSPLKQTEAAETLVAPRNPPGGSIVRTRILKLAHSKRSAAATAPLRLSDQTAGDNSTSDESAARSRTTLDEEEMLKQHLGRLPEAPSQETYERVPIQGYGESLLRAMGWTGNVDQQTLGAEPSPYGSKRGKRQRLGLGAPKE